MGGWVGMLGGMDHALLRMKITDGFVYNLLITVELLIDCGVAPWIELGAPWVY